jgi:uncharacterized Zn finger protein (UPF0148 family)
MSDIFKVKKSRETNNSKNKIGTLDSLHESYIEELQKKISKSNIEDLESKIQEKEHEINNRNFSPFDVEDSIILARLQKELSVLQDELKTSKEGLDIQNYYLEHGDIMLEYYAKPQIKTITKVVFGADKFSVAEANTGTSKKKMYDEYLARRGLSNGMNVAEYSEHLKKMAEHCETCNVAREEIHAEGILVCPKCGSEEYSLVVSDFPSFRDPPKERNNYAYKKQNHLNEILNQFQAKESTEIPEEVMNEVICEIKKRRIDNIALLDEQQIRDILKKLGRNRYYEHATHILSRINGNPPPTLSPEIEDKIRAMFQEVQAPYLLYCPDDRRNMLSYHYIIYKFLELMELDEYKIHFPLLKSRDRLIQHDQIWKKICDYLQWEFISSV